MAEKVEGVSSFQIYISEVVQRGLTNLGEMIELIKGNNAVCFFIKVCQPVAEIRSLKTSESLRHCLL